MDSAQWRPVFGGGGVDSAGGTGVPAEGAGADSVAEAVCELPYADAGILFHGYVDGGCHLAAERDPEPDTDSGRVCVRVLSCASVRARERTRTQTRPESVS